MQTRDLELEQANKERIRAAFDEWAAGTGGPFALLADDATWTVVGNSPVSGTYHGRKVFFDAVLDPLNARMSTPLRPAVRALLAEDDWVIVLFDASAIAADGKPYDNTYSWHLRLRDGAVVEVVAFLDTIALTDLWTRVVPT
jgi:uncharacterized protein